MSRSTRVAHGDWPEKVRAVKELSLKLPSHGSYPWGTVLLDVGPLAGLMREAPESVELNLTQGGRVLATVGRFGPGGKGGWDQPLDQGSLLPIRLADSDFGRLFDHGHGPVTELRITGKGFSSSISIVSVEHPSAFLELCAHLYRDELLDLINEERTTNPTVVAWNLQPATVIPLFQQFAQAYFGQDLRSVDMNLLVEKIQTDPNAGQILQTLGPAVISGLSGTGLNGPSNAFAFLKNSSMLPSDPDPNKAYHSGTLIYAPHLFIGIGCKCGSDWVGVVEGEW